MLAPVQPLGKLIDDAVGRALVARVDCEVALRASWSTAVRLMTTAGDPRRSGCRIGPPIVHASSSTPCASGWASSPSCGCRGSGWGRCRRRCTLASCSPVPERATVRVVAGEPDSTTRLAARAPASDGLKPTVTVQVPPGCTVVPEQVSPSTEKSSTPARGPGRLDRRRRGTERHGGAVARDRDGDRLRRCREELDRPEADARGSRPGRPRTVPRPPVPWRGLRRGARTPPGWTRGRDATWCCSDGFTRAPPLGAAASP